MKPKRWIIHIDMDAFFASIEQLLNPSLKGKPVVVGGNGNPRSRGVVSTASYEARKYGVSSAMPLKKAYELCPNCIFLPVRMNVYREFSEKIKEILKSYTQKVEMFSLDEAFVDLSGFKNPIKTAKEIKRRIKKETGLSLSIGVAPNKLLAKIASDFNKPDGFTVVTEKNKEKFLENLPVRKLWGVGKKTEERLKALGVERIKDLKRLSLQELIKRFGNAWGYMLYRHARGIDDTPVAPFRERKSISREVTFQYDIKNRTKIEKIIKEIAEDLGKWLEEKNLRIRTITLKIRFKDFKTLTKSCTFDKPINKKEEVVNGSILILKNVKIEKKVRLLGVRLSNFIKTWK